MLARAITELEANPVPARLTRMNVLYEAYQCFAQAPHFPKELKATVVKSRKSDKFLKKLEKYMVSLGGASKAGIWTTRAVDIIYVSVAASVASHLDLCSSRVRRVASRCDIFGELTRALRLT